MSDLVMGSGLAQAAVKAGHQQRLLGVGLQKTHGRSSACFVHQSRHQQGGVEVVKAP